MEALCFVNLLPYNSLTLLLHDARRIQKKWSRYTGKESSADQEHFNDLAIC